jgi:hypothetical protein
MLFGCSHALLFVLLDLYLEAVRTVLLQIIFTQRVPQCGSYQISPCSMDLRKDVFENM